MSCQIEITGLVKRFGDNTVWTASTCAWSRANAWRSSGRPGQENRPCCAAPELAGPPDQGTIRMGDVTVDAARATKAQILGLRRRTGFVFQNYALFANKTAAGTSPRG